MTILNSIRHIPLPVLQGVAKASSKVASLNSAGVLRTIQVNLLLAYPEMHNTQRLAMAKHSMTKQALSIAESAKSWSMPPEWSIDQIVDIHGLDILTTALADPKGMLAIVPHLGTWEIMNPWLNQFGAPTIMYKPVKQPQLDAFVLQGRQRLNAKLVPTDGSGVKEIFRTLKRGGFSVILPDHVGVQAGNVMAPFFGIGCLSSTLAPKLASKTRCQLVGLTCLRRDDNQGFDVYCDALTDADLYSKDIVTATTAMNHAVETMISRSPVDYMWSYKRFKHNEMGNDDVYWLTDQQIKSLRATL